MQRSPQEWCFWFIGSLFRYSKMWPLMLIMSKLLCSAFFKAVFLFYEGAKTNVFDTAEGNDCILSLLCWWPCSIISPGVLGLAALLCPAHNPQKRSMWGTQSIMHLKRDWKVRNQNKKSGLCQLFILPDTQTCQGRSVVYGSELVPTRGHFFCRKNKARKEMPHVNS